MSRKPLKLERQNTRTMLYWLKLPKEHTRIVKSFFRLSDFNISNSMFKYFSLDSQSGKSKYSLK